MSRLWPRITSRLPLLIFAGMYLLSCYIGVILLLVSPRFWTWTNFFSGPSLPPLDRGALFSLLILLNGGLLLLWLGYELSYAFFVRRSGWRLPSLLQGDHPDSRLALVLYGLSVSVAVWSLSRAGAFQLLSAWGNYNSYVSARWHLFSTLTFFEYTNIYTWLPLTSGYLVLCRRRWTWFLTVLGVLSFLHLSLFLKKSLLTGVLLVCLALWIYWYYGQTPRRTMRIGKWVGAVATFCAALYMVHAALTLRLVLSTDSKPFVSTEETTLRKPRGDSSRMDHQAQDVLIDEPVGLTKDIVVSFDKDLMPAKTGRSIALYTFFAPLTRTSVPAIAYVQLFPERIPYFHLDLGQDMLGFGRMPNDNRVVNNFLWPRQEGGSVAVPFNFVLYSQGGLPIALVASFLVGAFFGSTWCLFFRVQKPSISVSLVASLLLTFAWLNAIDSLRNNFLVSYGVFWGILPIMIILLWTRRHHLTRSRYSKGASAGSGDSVVKATESAEDAYRRNT